MSVALAEAPPQWGASGGGADEVVAPHGARPVVLVVTPDPDLRQELAQELRRRWTVVDQASDGLAALYALAQRAPDAVILDMDVPEVSGHRVYEVLRHDPQTRRAPVVMLATGTCQEVCAWPSGITAPESFFQKPVTVDELTAALAQTEVVPAYTRN